MPRILDFKGNRMNVFDIELKGKKIGTIVPNPTQVEKTNVTFENFDVKKREKANLRVIRFFFLYHLPATEETVRQVAVMTARAAAQ